MKQFRVLIIDDSLTIRAILEHIVGSDPECEVVGLASSIESAREVMANARPNVITLDLGLPGMDGMAFLDELKEATKHAPIIVISASTRDKSGTSREALARGAVACFDKASVVTDARRLISLLKRAALRPERKQVRVRRNDGAPKPLAGAVNEPELGLVA
jgi:two-component system chemotaxis response regulator CheB